MRVKKPQKNINSAEKQTVNGFIIRTYELSILRNQNNKYKIRKVLVKCAKMCYHTN